MASRGGQQLEVVEAFSGRRKRSKSRSQKTPHLAWMYQCLTKSPEISLFTRFSGDLSQVPPLEIQSYHYWKSVWESERFTHPIRYRRRTILIQPLTHSQASSGYKHKEIHPSVLSHLCRFCEQFFHGMTVQVAPSIDLSQINRLTRRVHHATNREQFLVSDIRKFLKSKRSWRVFCTLGVTVADLYPSPEWNFVLGEASMGEGCGVFSFGRYFNSATAPAATPSTTNAAVEIEEGEREQLKNLWVLMRVCTLCYDDHYQKGILIWRPLPIPFSFFFSPQVMSHELCHIFGLKHCYYFNCAMNESASIAKAATQPLFLCPICLRKMYKVIRFNPLERYRQMLQVIKQLHSAVLEASLKMKKEDSSSEGEGADHESVGGEIVGTAVQVSVEVSHDHMVTGTEPSETLIDSSDQIDHNTTDTSSTGPTNGMKELMDTDYHSDNSHEEQLEEAIVWLEKVVSSLGRFEDQWEEQRAGPRAKSKVV